MAVAVAGFGGELHSELEKAKESLKCIDENIKKLTGRDPAEAKAIAQQSRRGAPGANHAGDNFRGRALVQGGVGVNREKEIRRWDGAVGDGPPQPKRRALGPLYGRLGGRDRRGRDNDSGDDMPRKLTVQSSVVAHPKEQKTRKDCIDEQKTDATGMARNRRMFGLLLGTLQKFRVESQQTHDKEQKRMEIEKKLEEIAEKEKDDLRKERLDLFQERKRRQAELRRLEFKVELVKQHEEWEKHYDHLKNFIRTKTKPHVYYLPREASAVSEKRLADTRQEIDAMIVEKRQRVEEDVAMLGKRRAELAGAIEATNTVVVANEGSLAVATKRKRQSNVTKNGAINNDDSSSSASSSSDSSSNSGSDSDSEDGDQTAPLSKKTLISVDVNVELPSGGEQTDNITDGDRIEAKVSPIDETKKVSRMREGGLPEESLGTVEVELDLQVATAATSVSIAVDLSSEIPSKKEDEAAAIIAINNTNDILDQNNLTEKEFEPIYD